MSDQKQWDNSNSGTLYRNDRKELTKHPDYKGKGEVDNVCTCPNCGHSWKVAVKFWISAWLKTAKDGSKNAGQKFFSFAFQNQVKDDPGAYRPARSGATPAASSTPTQTGRPSRSVAPPPPTSTEQLDEDVPF